MPSSRGADRIGVSLGSHRPTVILKLTCLVEKKRTKVRSLVVLFSAANWDRSPARSDWNCMRTYYQYSGTRGGTTSRSTYCSPGIKTSSRLAPISSTPRTLSRPRAIVSCCFYLVFFRCWYRQDPARWCLLVGSERILSTCILKRER